MQPTNQATNQQVPQGNVAGGQTPAQGYTPGQTPAPAQGYAPGQTSAPAQGYTPGQTPAPAQGYTPGQTPGQVPPQSTITGPPASPSDDFTHVYQTGNFGKHFGKVNTTRGKRYVIVHGVLSLFMIVFTIVAAVMMKHYLPAAIKNPLLGVSWACAVCDGLSTGVALYFMWKLSTLTHPLRTLMVMRTFATFSMVMNIFFFMIGIFSAILKEKEFVELTDKEIGFLKAIYAVIAVLMFLKIFTSTSFIFQWWSCCPACPTACSCFAPYCIYEEGEELAPGVPNSIGVQNIMVVGMGAAAAAQRMNRM
ncbi:uncharacterized protein LOC116289929 [Actinia tenebrosa]|uniref:Uncharacterized protein LOC116289929 n=1 Tax=Actinia tenebrosa TaxID=6105 RepID=A0A6P8HJG2_ACTTE|nr:uncharacterized protein LOC116289929 [Actinia tenebrosa]